MEIILIGVGVYIIYIMYKFFTAEKCNVCFGNGHLHDLDGRVCPKCGGSGRIK